VSQARVDLGRAAVLVAELEKAERHHRATGGLAVHQMPDLVPQEELGRLAPRDRPETAFGFDLAEADLIDLSSSPTYRCRDGRGPWQAAAAGG